MDLVGHQATSRASRTPTPAVHVHVPRSIAARTTLRSARPGGNEIAIPGSLPHCVCDRWILAIQRGRCRTTEGRFLGHGGNYKRVHRVYCALRVNLPRRTKRRLRLAPGRRSTRRGAQHHVGTRFQATGRPCRPPSARRTSGPRSGISPCDFEEFANLEVARPRERQGDNRAALSAVRRRPYSYHLTDYLAPHLREEGRLATLSGDTSGDSGLPALRGHCGRIRSRLCGQPPRRCERSWRGCPEALTGSEVSHPWYVAFSRSLVLPSLDDLESACRGFDSLSNHFVGRFLR